MSANEQLVINGTINRAVYRSLKRYIMAPAFKIGVFVLIIVYDAWLIIGMILDRSIANLLIMLLFTGFMVFFFLHNQEALVKKAINSEKAIRDGDGLSVTLTFGESQIRMHNITLNRERNIPYSDFVSQVETDRCIALFVKNNYLMIPKDMMDEAMCEKVREIIRVKCPKLKKRI